MIGEHRKREILTETYQKKEQRASVLNDTLSIIEMLEALTVAERKHIFGNASISIILENYTLTEIADVIKHAPMSSAISIGDIVRYKKDGALYLVITEEPSSDWPFGVIDLQDMCVDQISGSLCDFEKTGYHTTNIAVLPDIIRQIKEEEKNEHETERD